MNKDIIVALFNDGAYFNGKENKFYHPSFRKGWRKMTYSNISLIAAERVLGSKLTFDSITNIKKLDK